MRRIGEQRQKEVMTNLTEALPERVKRGALINAGTVFESILTLTAV
jgi:hypothetical protein